MVLKLHVTAAAVLATLGLAGCQGVSPQGAADTLVAARVASAPNMNALAADPAWAKAKPLQVALTGGQNLVNGETSATLKAVYTDDMLYMLIQYKDPTYSVRRVPYQKQADGSWKQIRDPNDKGGDNNLVYEDKWSLIFPIDEGLTNAFEQQGCAVLCHEGEGKPFGNKYTRKDGELADMWHMKGMRTGPIGHVDDQYVDHTRHSQATPNAGRKGDPGTQGGEYTPVKLVNGKPEFMAKTGLAANAGGTYYIKRGEEVTFVDNFKPGDELAAHISNYVAGDRADVKAVQKWENGVWTNVISRKLKTGSKFDVQFEPTRRYPFGFAVFDNAQVRHATPDDTSFLVFGK